MLVHQGEVARQVKEENQGQQEFLVLMVYLGAKEILELLEKQGIEENLELKVKEDQEEAQELEVLLVYLGKMA